MPSILPALARTGADTNIGALQANVAWWVALLPFPELALPLLEYLPIVLRHVERVVGDSGSGDELLERLDRAGGDALRRRCRLAGERRALEATLEALGVALPRNQAELLEAYGDAGRFGSLADEPRRPLEAVAGEQRAHLPAGSLKPGL